VIGVSARANKCRRGEGPGDSLQRTRDAELRDGWGMDLGPRWEWSVGDIIVPGVTLLVLSRSFRTQYSDMDHSLARGGELNLIGILFTPSERFPPQPQINTDIPCKRFLFYTSKSIETGHIYRLIARVCIYLFSSSQNSPRSSLMKIFPSLIALSCQPCEC
jgi:hypothetical protein